MLHPGVRKLGERMLPGFLLRRLDPVQAIIEDEIVAAAEGTGENQVVLDAGAGEARQRKYFRRGTYVALDIGTGDPAWDYSHLDICGDLQRLPLRGASVDRVLCIVVLEHTRDPRQVVQEFSRVLKQGGTLHIIVPLLWEEHQAPHDYFRFTRYGVMLLFESLPFRIEMLRPMGGFFWLSARRSVNLLSFFQRGWRWALFVLLAPFFGFLFPLVLFSLDRLDREKAFSLGFQVRAVKTCGCCGTGDERE
jgi:SAM-dependent methyltransferase